MKVLAGFLVLGLVLFVGVGTAGARSSNPQHSIDFKPGKNYDKQRSKRRGGTAFDRHGPGLDEHGPHDYTASGLDTRQRRKAEELSTASPASKEVETRVKWASGPIKKGPDAHSTSELLPLDLSADRSADSCQY